MGFLRRRGSKERNGGATTLAEPPSAVYRDFEGCLDDIRVEVERLADENRRRPDLATERRLLSLRHLEGIKMLDAGSGQLGFAHADVEGLPAFDGLPEIACNELTPGLLRAGILRDGCLLVRGLVERERALAYAREIDRAFEMRERLQGNVPFEEGYYENFERHPRYGELEGREWVQLGGGVLAADAPPLAFELREMFRAAGLPALVEAYLGEPALISVEKTTLRKAEPSVPGAWHQDGNFMGAVRSLNLWLSLSRCGDEAPGLDVVPRRLKDLVRTQTEEAVLDIQVSQRQAEEAAGDRPIERPIFEPGDALFFDELFLHKTGSDPSMPKPRFAVENWFFGASAFPAEYAPLAL
jgi:hypothetical protein